MYTKIFYIEFLVVDRGEVGDHFRQDPPTNFCGGIAPAKRIRNQFFTIKIKNMSQKMARTIGAEELRFNRIMNSRLEVGLGHAGKVIRCKVSGNPLLGYFDDRIPNPVTGQPEGALKDIYSFNVNKASVLDSAWFQQNHAKAIALEAAGNVEEARELFNQLLNSSQLSYGIINRDGTKQQFNRDQMVDLTIAVVDAVDRDEDGKETGTTHKALVVDGMSAVAATMLTKSKRFGADVEESVPATAPAQAVAAVAATI